MTNPDSTVDMAPCHLAEANEDTEMMEVLSIPAGTSFDLAAQYAVYSCPISYSFRPSLYITLRKEGAVMDRLYLRKNTYRLPASLKTIAESPDIPEEDKKQILAYLKAAIGRNMITEFDPTQPDYGDDIKVVVMDRDRVVWLPYPAKMARAAVARVYYTLRELLDPRTAPVARPANQEND